MKIPLNRIVAFLGPYIAALSGFLATWLVTNIHFLGLFHVGHDQIALAISQILVFAVTTGVVWLGHQTWLKGWQAHEARTFQLPSLDDSANKEAPKEEPKPVEEPVEDPVAESPAPVAPPKPEDQDVA